LGDAAARRIDADLAVADADRDRKAAELATEAIGDLLQAALDAARHRGRLGDEVRAVAARRSLAVDRGDGRGPALRALRRATDKAAEQAPDDRRRRAEEAERLG